MMPTTHLKDIIVALNHLPPSFKPCITSIFDFQPKHVFVLDKTLFTQPLTIVPHLFLKGLSGMVYEHLSKCFIPKDPSSQFSKLFQVIVITHDNILKLMALVLGESRLLAMVKDISGLHLIAIKKVIF
jgi:hypothetical protein